jgi:hypothetical protein
MDEEWSGMKSRTTYWQNSFPNHLEFTFHLEELKLAGAFDLPRAIKLIATSDSDFYVNSQFRTPISFVTSESGKVTGAVINPERWALSGQRNTD